MTINRSNQRGFSLIEVMLAVLVLSVGILGVSKLQGQLVRGGAEANQRSIASNLIQQKSDDLRRFVYLTTASPIVPDAWTTALATPTSLAFVHIASNEGGLIDPGNQTIGNISYDLSWKVNNYYYSADNAIATTTPNGDKFPAFKTAHIVVNWSTVSSTNNVVSFDTIIDAYGLANTDLGGDPSSSGTGPVVEYNPLSAPDVVPVTLGTGDLKKETSKPLPDVSKKGDSTLVKFETVTYNLNNKTQRREEFRTLACNCTSSGATPNNSIIQGLVTWDDIDERIVDITTNVTPASAIAKSKVDNSGGEDQDDACTFCCRDGADLAGTTFKVCRFKRIDGVLRITEPWKLVAFNMIPASYFNDSDGLAAMTTTLQGENIDRYSSYVTTTVRNVLADTGSKSDLNNYSTVDLTFINDTTTYTNASIDHLLFNVGSSNKRDIQVRGVYMDYPPNGIYTQITGQTTYYDASTVPLDRVPFYEVNLTQLAGWIPDVNVLKNGANTGDIAFTNDYPDQHDDMDNSSCVNTSNASFGRNYVTNEDFFYQGGGTTTTCNNASRGEFYPISTTSAETISSEIYTGSDGIVDRNITGNTTKDISLNLKVQ
jgi:prepilin-type N-terminal cleavage/methylation domain-containing protein